MKTRYLLIIAALAGCRPYVPAPPTPTPPPPPRIATHDIIPAPASWEPVLADTFTLRLNAIIVAQGGAEVERIARYLADLVGTTVESTPRVLTAPDTTQSRIDLVLDANAPAGNESYELSVTRERVRIAARAPAGLFYGVQTLRQLLPYTVEYTAALARPMRIAGVRITDSPRFEYRGQHLDVARHFLGVRDVQKFMDLLAMYKLNRLHLHLSDDQGWRIEIPGWPNLTTIGGSTQVGGKGGGYYTQQDFRDLVRYARDRFITIVPEIDMPGHTNAALVAFPQLSCGTRPPALYTGTAVGFSTFCVDNEETYRLIEDVMRELAALTPGPWLHMGGDEVEALTHEQYAHFVERVQEIITRTGKQMVGWEEITKARLLPTTLAQQWKSDSAAAAVRQGLKVIVSPASRTYVDMKYDDDTEIGLDWAGQRDVEMTYDWDPATFTPGITEGDIMGVEAPLWTETVKNLTAAQYLAFPRLPAIAEIGWTPSARREWSSFRNRLAAHAPRWRILGINYYRSPQVPWGR